MGFNQCYVPELNELIELYNKIGLENLIKRYRKYDSYTGSSDSMQFLETKFKEYYEQDKRNNDRK